MLSSEKQVTHVCIIVFLMVFFAFGFLNSEASAEPTLNLSINKIAGFQSGSVLSGSFVVSSVVSGDVGRVEFYLNGTLQVDDTEAPFTWTSDTKYYPVGNYNITAVAYSASKQNAVSAINETFVEMPILTPILLLVLILVGLFIAAPILYVWHITRKPKTIGDTKQDQPK
jgi:hypothetical protein